MRVWSPRVGAALLAAAAVAAVSAGAPASASKAKPTRNVTVMTRNLFLGADLIPLATAAPGAPFEQAVAKTLADVEATSPTVRMKLIAKEIADAKPDLVGLQEVSLWSTKPAASSGAASHVVVDYLGTIMAELKRLHAPYRVVAKRLSLHLHGPSTGGLEVDFTDGNAILARSGVTVRNARSGDFTHELQIPTQAIGTVNVNRSWNALDATVGGATFHFVNAHLEAYSTDVRLQQAKDLLAGPLRSKLQTILVGDLNSNSNLPKLADRPPYLALRAAGFAEERTPQNNCCLQDSLSSGSWDHIVDHIMARPRVKLVRSYITGQETAGGRHPSDHGGVVSTLGL